MALVVNNLPANGGDERDTGSVPGLGRSPGGGNGNRIQYSCLENCMDIGATSLSLFTFMHWRRKWQPTPVFLPGESQGQGVWWAAIYGVAQSRTWLKWLSSSSRSLVGNPVKWLSTHKIYRPLLSTTTKTVSSTFAKWGGHGNPLQYSCLENPQGQRSLAGYSLCGRKESDAIERLSTAQLMW